MYVIKRDGKKEAIKFDKITARIMKMCYGLDPIVSPEAVAMKVIEGIYDGISTMDLDNLAADVASTRAIEHPDYALLASRIAISNLHKETKKSFSEVMTDLYSAKDVKTGDASPLIAQDVYDIICNNKDLLDSTIIYDRDFKFDYLGFRILADHYLMRIDNFLVERPQQLLMRLAVGIHKTNIPAVIKTYNYLSEGWMMHDITTLNNAGRPNAQLLSSYSLSIDDSSVETIYATIKSAAQISNGAGELGVNISRVFASEPEDEQNPSLETNGILPMLHVFDETARHTTRMHDKKRNHFSVFLEPWHADVEAFLEIKKPHIGSGNAMRNLTNVLWIPDLFMHRVKNNEDWTLFSPKECSELANLFGKEFENTYERFEKMGIGVKTIKAQDLWFKILEAQIETGMPYMMYKDAVNEKSNQKNAGIVKASNYSVNLTLAQADDAIGACSVGAIVLPKFVDSKKEFNFEKLFEVTYQMALNLNQLLDENYYPVESAHDYCQHFRPIGISVVGLADTYALMGIPFDSEAAQTINRSIFETIYYSALTASKDEAKINGAYSSFKNSPLAKGQFQFNQWNVTPTERWDWETLKAGIVEHGVRNALLVTVSSTESIAQILGYNENIEPFASNISIKRKTSGEYAVINKYLLKDLIATGLWDKEMRQQITLNSGSIQAVERIPSNLKAIYKTVWEIPQKTLLNLAIDRSAFICQSQAMNVYMENADFSKLTTLHFYAWEKGLKTGMCQLTTKTTVDNLQFSIHRENRVIDTIELEQKVQKNPILTFENSQSF